MGRITKAGCEFALGGRRSPVAGNPRATVSQKGKYLLESLSPSVARLNSVPVPALAVRPVGMTMSRSALWQKAPEAQLRQGEGLRCGKTR